MAIRYTGGGADFMPLGYQDENITVEDLTNNTDAGNFLISAANALPNQSGIINALPNIMSPGVRTIENQAMRNFEQPYDMRDVAGESLPFNIDNLGNPNNDPRVVSEELGITGFGRPTMADIAGMDLPQGMPSQYDQSAVDGYEDLIQNPLDNPNRLQNIEREVAMDNMDFYNDTGKYTRQPGEPLFAENFTLGDILDPDTTLTGYQRSPVNQFNVPAALLSAYGALAPSNIARAGGAFFNRDAISRGLGSIANKMRGGFSTQAAYEADRAKNQTIGRVKDMMARKEAGKSYSQTNLDRLSKELARERDNRPENRGRTTTNVTGFGKSGLGRDKSNITGETSGGSSGPSGKIVCTMMNNSYGFGSFRNKIWLKHSRDLPKEYEVGYHTIFLPLVKFAKGEGKLNKVVKKTLEHIARHRTYDLKQEMKGKTHLLGRAYRKVLEPICFITGKIKSALGRG